MKQEIINGGNARYLGELERFKDGIPFGIVNKTKTDVGGTYVAANCSSNYIIVCPFKDLVDSIAADKNNRYEVFKCYGGVREYQFRKYIKNNTTYKIAVTYDSLPKLIGWLSSTEGWKVLVDEYHLILEDMDFRYDAINGLMEEIQKFRHYSFLSATPIDLDFEIDFLKQLPHYKVQWNGVTKITPIRYKVTQLTKGLARFIQIFLDEGISLPDINGNVSKVEELYIFINSVTSIKQIADTLKLNPDDVKICCADRIRNNKLLGEYQIESVSSPNKKINFFTKKCFQGCNLFTNNGLIIVASDAYRTQTLVDISTTMEQIAGRIRINDEYQNIFRNVIVHLFSTNKNVMSDEEFEMMMQDKEKEADKLLSGWSKLDKGNGGKYKAFDPLYGTHHKFYGAMDYFYASTFANGYAPGLMDARIGGRFRASDKVDMELNYHYFSTAVKVQDLKKYLGSEVDYQINWSIMKDVKLSAGYSFMRGTKTMDAVKTGNHKSWQDWGWLSLNINPKILFVKW